MRHSATSTKTSAQADPSVSVNLRCAPVAVPLPARAARASLVPLLRHSTASLRQTGVKVLIFKNYFW